MEAAEQPFGRKITGSVISGVPVELRVLCTASSQLAAFSGYGSRWQVVELAEKFFDWQMNGSVFAWDAASAVDDISASQEPLAYDHIIHDVFSGATLFYVFCSSLHLQLSRRQISALDAPANLRQTSLRLQSSPCCMLRPVALSSHCRRRAAKEPVQQGLLRQAAAADDARRCVGGQLLRRCRQAAGPPAGANTAQRLRQRQVGIAWNVL